VDSTFRTPLGRRERQKQEREQRILDAARWFFNFHGYADTTMEDIARVAKLAVGTLYNYFSSKDDLLISLIRLGTERVTALAERIVADPPADPVESIAALADAFMENVAAEDRRLWREVFAASIAAPDTLGVPLLALDARMIQLFAMMVEKLKQRGAFSPRIDAPRAAGLFYGICLNWMIAYATQGSLTHKEMHTEVSQSISMAVCGMLRRPADD
jgi:AcrR family transcriptional regulator